MVSVTYDPSALSVYIDLENGLEIAKTIPMGEGRYADLAEDGKLIGLEIVFAKSTPVEMLHAILNIPKEMLEEMITKKPEIKVLA